MKLEWTFNGVGTTACTHDGVTVLNCKAPMVIQANEISSEDTKHNFTVTFTDICGREKVASFSYTQKGVVPETVVDPVVPVTLSGNGVASGSDGSGSGSSGSGSGSNTSAPASGDKKNAAVWYKKSVELAPADRKARIEALLKQVEG